MSLLSEKPQQSLPFKRGRTQWEREEMDVKEKPEIITEWLLSTANASCLIHHRFAVQSLPAENHKREKQEEEEEKKKR